MGPIPLQYTEALVRRAVRAWWWRGVDLPVRMAATVAGAALGVLLWTDPTGGWTLALGGLAAVAVGVSAAAYLVPLRRSLRVVRAMDGGRATLHLRDDGFEMSSSAGRADVPWAGIAEVVATPEAWLLVHSRSRFSTLPLADLTPEVRAYIGERVRMAGGTVRA